MSVSLSEVRGNRLAVIGSGAMGGGLMRALVNHGVLDASQIVATDIDEIKLRQLKEEIGVEVSRSNVSAVKSCDIVLLAVKPQVVPLVLAEISPNLLSERHLLISIVAGITISQLERSTPPHLPVVRVMPNTPCLVGAGVCAIALGTHATEAHRQVAHALFRPMGITIDVQEEWMDAITAVSGSGPAYVFTFIEALSDAGVNVGLPRNIATHIAIQTVLGAATMAAKMQRHLAELREMVTSPGGTTIAALHVLERNGFRGIVMDAVLAAVERARTISKAAEVE
ncbi:MAG: pyrroline-5-carboxylate reductase [Armatimonadota bacterium]|nr:pyrroline-5-carboxylate reductase [Armatimonadota bacterium]MDW8025605.1 pyrroline-5-carboxylate reductase [Armatimonadota bacterium]